MLTKLAFKNAGKSIREYAIYFFTLVFGVCIFYMFNSIYAQREVMVVTETVNKSMLLLRQVLSYISVFVAVILGFLIIYANNFFIKRRKKELGIYMVLGMKKSSISLILILETFVMAIVALIVGLILGIFASQFMSIFTAKLFEADMTGFVFVFSLDATLKSILYFGIIFLIVMIFNTFSIGKFKLIDLIYGSKRNEVFKTKNKHLSVILFVISIICLISAYFLILWNGMLNLNIWFTICIILGIIGTFLFFYSIAAIIRMRIASNEKIYFKNLNMFVSRQIFSKINSNFVSISIICLSLLLVIGIFSTGYSLQEMFSKELRNSVKYDYSFFAYGEKANNSMKELFPEKIINSEYIDIKFEFSTYVNYNDDEGYFKNYLARNEDNKHILGRNLIYIKLSDYNELMGLLKKDSITLADESCIIVYNNNIYLKQIQEFARTNKYLLIDDVKINILEVVEETISNSSDLCYIVVQDKYTDELSIDSKILNVQMKSDKAEIGFLKLLEEYTKDSDYNIRPYNHYLAKSDLYLASITTKTIVAFLAIYLGIVFMVTSAAILAIQQLSDAADNRERYKLLGKLGASKVMLNKALFKQIMIYFLAPLILAVIHSIVGLTAANEVIIQFGKVNVWSSILVTSGFVIFIYMFYFIITYVGAKNIIRD